MAEKFNAGTMKVEREALLWCGFQWRRKPRWRPRARKKQDDERAKGVVDGRADPADRRRAIGYCLSARGAGARSEEHTSELQSRLHLVCRLLLEKKKTTATTLSTPPSTITKFTTSSTT